MCPNLDLDKGDKELLSLLFVIVVHRPATLVDYSKNYYIKRLLYMHTRWPKSFCVQHQQQRHRHPSSQYDQ